MKKVKSWKIGKYKDYNIRVSSKKNYFVFHKNVSVSGKAVFWAIPEAVKWLKENY